MPFALARCSPLHDAAGRGSLPMLAGLSLACASLAVHAQQAEERARPLWEAGVAVFGLNAPDYPAAGRNQWRAAAAPVLIYRGPMLKVDGEGVRGRLLDRGRWSIDLSAAAAFNARENPARRGMPPLDYTFELGPQVIYRVPLDGSQQISAHLKTRAVFSTNGRRSHGHGGVIEPEVRWQRRGWPDAASQVQLAVQATWASEALQEHFYQVDPRYQTAGRPAYDARPGYFGSAVRVGLSRRFSPTTVANVSAGFNVHNGAANQNSPLFERRTTAGVFVAWIWTPWQSSQLAP